MTTTLSRRSINSFSQNETDLFIEKTLSSFRGISSTRKPNWDLISDAFTFAQESLIQAKVFDLITIYRMAIEMRTTLPAHRIIVCDKFIDEVESSLSYFLDHKILPVRKVSIAQIFDPVAERQTQRT